jgi:signal transduction histidine kinase
MRSSIGNSSTTGIQNFASYLLNSKFYETVEVLLSLANNDRLNIPERKKRILFEKTLQEILTGIAYNPFEAIYNNRHYKVPGYINFTIIEYQDILHDFEMYLLDLAGEYCTEIDSLKSLTKEISLYFHNYRKVILKNSTCRPSNHLQNAQVNLDEIEEIGQIGSFIWNLEDQSKICSKQLRKILETEKDQSLHEFLQHVHEEDRSKIEEEFNKSMESGFFNCEYRYSIGNKYKTLYSRAIVEKKDGHPIIMQGTIQDISSWKKLESDLLEKLVLLQDSNNRMEHFAAIASHDLQEPLRKISTYVSIIEKNDNNELTATSKHYVDKIKKDALRMRNLIDDLLSYSINFNNQKPIHCDLEEILKDVIESLELSINEKNAKIESDGLPKGIFIPFQVKQLFQNLISNSLKFCKPEEPPIIKITHRIEPSFDTNSENRSKTLIIEIKDNCIGFSEIHHQKIFDFFYRAHDRKLFEGTGLGLAICKKIVQNHHGTITVESKENIGSVFKIVFPYMSENN